MGLIGLFVPHKSWSKMHKHIETTTKEASGDWNQNLLISADLTVQQWRRQKSTGHPAKSSFQIVDGKIKEGWGERGGEAQPGLMIEVKGGGVKDHLRPFNRWLTEDSWKSRMWSPMSILWGKHTPWFPWQADCVEQGEYKILFNWSHSTEAAYENIYVYFLVKYRASVSYCWLKRVQPWCS